MTDARLIEQKPRGRKKADSTDEPIEKQLWKTADKLRKNIDAAEYKHIVLGLVFLKYISDAFAELHTKLLAEKDSGADPEDKDEYKAENVFFVPPGARWSFLQSHAKQPTIGKTVDEAMDAIERENDSLKGVLPKVYARQNLDPTGPLCPARPQPPHQQHQQHGDRGRQQEADSRALPLRCVVGAVPAVEVLHLRKLRPRVAVAFSATA